MSTSNSTGEPLAGPQYNPHYYDNIPSTNTTTTVSSGATTPFPMTGGLATGSLGLSGSLWHNTTISPNHIWSTTAPDIVVKPGDGQKIIVDIDGQRHDIVEIVKVVNELKQMAMIIVENQKLHEEYPALKAAYESYMTLKTLATGDNT